VGIPIAAILIVVPRGAWWIHVGLFACLLALVWLARRMKTQGVEATGDGYIVHNAFATTRLGWNEINNFYTKRWVFNQEVFVLLKNGEKVRTSLAQGLVVVWKGGRTRDILSILRDELRVHTHGASPIPESTTGVQL